LSMLVWQGKVFLAALAIGGLAGFLYDVYRVIRERANIRRGAGSALADLLFSAAVAGLVFALLLKANQAELRLYVLLGLAGGALLYFPLLSGLGFRLADFVLHLAGRVEDLFFTLPGWLIRVLLFPLSRPLVIVWRYSAGTGTGNWKHFFRRHKRN